MVRTSRSRQHCGSRNHVHSQAAVTSPSTECRNVAFHRMVAATARLRPEGPVTDFAKAALSSICCTCLRPVLAHGRSHGRGPGRPVPLRQSRFGAPRAAARDGSERHQHQGRRSVVSPLTCRATAPGPMPVVLSAARPSTAGAAARSEPIPHPPPPRHTGPEHPCPACASPPAAGRPAPGLGRQGRERSVATSGIHGPSRPNAVAGPAQAAGTFIIICANRDSLVRRARASFRRRERHT
jgi:hypothetical protein